MTDSPKKKSHFMKVLLRFVLIVLILGGGAFVAKRFIDSKRVPKRKPPEELIHLVAVMAVQPSAATLELPAMGVVTPAEEIELASRVEGKLLSVSPSMIVGGVLKKGAIAAQVDSADYELLIAQRQSDIVRAERELKSEQGQQRIARREYEMLKGTVTAEDRELVLREPQLKQAQAAVASAKARLAEVELDIRRTTIRSPFNALVQRETVGVGTLVRNGTPLATLVNIDAYWVLLSVPMDELRFISVPGFNAPVGSGSSVRIECEAGWGKGKFRTGSVTRLLGDLEPQGRMARVVVTVDDPRSRKTENADKPHLLMGSYVRAKITGKTLKNVLRLPRRVVHENNTVWLVRKTAKAGTILGIQTISPFFKTREEIWIPADSLAVGDRIIMTDLSAPVEGMKLRVDGDPVPVAKAKPVAPKPAGSAK